MKKKTTWAAARLAQAKDPRSGEGSALAQATSSRLGETATEGVGSFAKARLGQAISFKRDGLSLKTQLTRLSEYSNKILGRDTATRA